MTNSWEPGRDAATDSAQRDRLLGAVQRYALLAGLVGGSIFAAGMLDQSGRVFTTQTHVQFFRSYLVAYLLVLSLPLGSMAIMMVHHLTGGRWGLVIRRLCESGMATMPLAVVLFLPLVLGFHWLYPWTDPEYLEHHPLVAKKTAYLNEQAFFIRAAGYFAVWLLLSFMLTRRSDSPEPSVQRALTRRLRQVSGPGLVLYILTISFAAIDWGMSLEPEWFSSIYGAIYLVGQVLAALALMTITLILLSPYPPLRDVARPGDLNDLGNLLLAFVMLWAYVSFSQFLLIWSANLPEETPYYLSRAHGPWQGMALGLVLCHFALPFLLLLSRNNKRNRQTLLAIAAGTLLMRWVDVYWLIMPAFEPRALAFHLLDLLAPVAVGGWWLAAFAWQLRRRPLLAPDPRLKEAVHG
jgi:hypothetical protein